VRKETLKQKFGETRCGKEKGFVGGGEKTISSGKEAQIRNSKHLGKHQAKKTIGGGKQRKRQLGRDYLAPEPGTGRGESPLTEKQGDPRITF